MGGISAQAVRLTEKGAVLPAGFDQEMPDDAVPLPMPADDEAQPIAGFICMIEYADADGVISKRFISCRRYELFDRKPRVGAICGKSGRYKLFNCDRVMEVRDVETRELLGDGRFFEQFAIGMIRERAHDWNTTSQRKALIVAGLNVLCFMARCDGHWHPLEEQVIEDFVCSLWMRKEWDGEPPIDAIVSHARRLAPDGEVFRTAIRQYAHSRSSSIVLSRFVHRVIAADGVICDHEHRWAAEFTELLDDVRRGHAVERKAQN